MRWSVAVCALLLSVGCIGQILSPEPSEEDPNASTPPPSDSPATPPPTTEPPVTLPPPSSPPGGLDPSASAECDWAAPKATTLSQPQYRRTILGLADGHDALVDELSSVLTDGPRGMQLSQPTLEALLQASEPYAAAVGAQTCADDDRIDCVRTMVAELGRRAFRRPLRGDEVDRYVAFYAEELEVSDAVTARSMVVQSLLIAPETLFRTEVGDATAGSRVLTSYEKAQALSYVITDGPPDDALWAAAESGALDSEDGMRTHAARLLQRSDTSEGLLAFIDSIFHYRGAGELAKDPQTYPAWDEALGEDIAEASERFVHHVLWASEGTLAELLTAPYMFVNDRLGQTYGIEAEGPTFRQVVVPAARRGLLMQPGFLATYANDDSSAPIARGHFVREELMCQSIPPTPPDALNNFVPRDPSLTARQWLSQQHAVGACANCHRLMDPIGLTLEQFDGIGAFRTEDVGQAIDVSGQITAYQSLLEDIPVDGPVQLVDALAHLPEVEACVTERLFAFVYRRDATEADACAIQELSTSFSKDHQIRDLLVRLVSQPHFVTRSEVIR